MLILLGTEKTSGLAFPWTFCAVHGWGKLLCQMVQSHASKCFSIAPNRQLPWKKPTSLLTSTSLCFPAVLYFLDLHCRSFAKHPWSSLTTPHSVRGGDVSSCLYPLKLDVPWVPVIVNEMEVKSWLIHSERLLSSVWPMRESNGPQLSAWTERLSWFLWLWGWKIRS